MSKTNKQFAITVSAEIAEILDPLREERRISEYVAELVRHHHHRARHASGCLQRHGFGAKHLGCLMDILNGTIFVDGLPLLTQVRSDMHDADPETIEKWGVDPGRWAELTTSLIDQQAQQIKNLHDEYWHHKTPITWPDR